MSVSTVVLMAALVPLMWAGDTDAQTAKTTKYTYDALGRLTFVEDSQNGNRDYDYDAAGNRRNVAVATASDAASESSVPGKPTGLSMTNPTNCTWSASWAATPGATSYKFRETNGPLSTTTATNKTVICPSGQPNVNKPYWVQACNANGCGDIAHF